MASSQVNDLKKFAAYNRVVSKFLDACKEEDLDAIECVHAVYRFLGIQPPQGSSSTPSQGTPQLSKEEFDRVKKAALNAKAKKLGVSSQEIKLTLDEINHAKSEALAKRGNVSSTPSKSKKDTATAASQQKEQSALQPGNSQAKEKKDPFEGLGEVQFKARKESRDKLRDAKKVCQQANPLGKISATKLHLVAYANHRIRLAKLWAIHQGRYTDAGMKNPLDGLVDPSDSQKRPKCAAILSTAYGQLQKKADDSDTYDLTVNGTSFWNQSLPSEACPEYLKEELPEDSLEELRGAILP